MILDKKGNLLISKNYKLLERKDEVYLESFLSLKIQHEQSGEYPFILDSDLSVVYNYVYYSNIIRELTSPRDSGSERVLHDSQRALLLSSEGFEELLLRAY